jgi:L-aspartate oxidase
LSLHGAPRFLLSEALRGEGALLLNSAKERFMSRYDPRAELAPRDIVARAIVQEIAAAKVTPAVAFLDMRHLDSIRLRERFPRIYATCKQYGVDIATDLVPVRPAAHYLMGGIKTDLSGRSTLPGLYSAGEAACTGVHGANRLASNSLLEGLVFGARAAEAMRNQKTVRSAEALLCSAERSQAAKGNAVDTQKVFSELRSAMWKHAGVIRNREGLEELRAQIGKWGKLMISASSRQTIELRNLCIVGQLIDESALAREESRGAHFRTDCPARNDAQFRKHSIVARERMSFA